MRIGIDTLSAPDASECGRDFNVKWDDKDDTYVGRLGAICIGDISEMYLVTSQPEVYALAIDGERERMMSILSSDSASANNILRMLKHALRLSEQG